MELFAEFLLDSEHLACRKLPGEDYCLDRILCYGLGDFPDFSFTYAICRIYEITMLHNLAHYIVTRSFRYVANLFNSRFSLRYDALYEKGFQIQHRLLLLNTPFSFKGETHFPSGLNSGTCNAKTLARG